MDLRNSGNPVGQKSEFVYTKCYCEENIWKFTDTLRESPLLPGLFILFLSSRKHPDGFERVPVWFQKQRGVVTWDYHVIAIHSPGHHSLASLPLSDDSVVYDFDTFLQWGVPLPSYFFFSILLTRHEFPDSRLDRLLDDVFFRLVPATAYLEHFASDRSHMLDLENDPTGQTYEMPPPPYDPIRTDESTMNLLKYRDVGNRTNEEVFGRVFSVEEFARDVIGRSVSELMELFGRLYEQEEDEDEEDEEDQDEIV